MFQFGRDCLCRRESPSLGSFSFPLCWRCTGIAAGIGVLQSASSMGALEGFTFTLGVSLGVVCGLPAAVDVFCQMAGAYRSNPGRRLGTGMLLGSGVVLLAHSFVPLFRGLF
jgi:uncharacterized membrane protein